MLGIRRYQGASIDLYVGDPALFVCDLSGTDVSVLEEAARQGLRHVVLHQVNTDVFADIRTFLDNRTSKNPERITIVLESLSVYKDFQPQLFATFAEVDACP